MTMAFFIAIDCFAIAPKITSDSQLRGDQGYFSDTIVLQSAGVACLGTDPVLSVTGVNVTWYADKDKKIKLGAGNTFHSSPLHTTTNFYLTQTVNGIESEITIITIEIVTAILDGYSTIQASCSRQDGSFLFLGSGGSQRYPVKFKLDDGPLQTSGLFKDLAAGNYTLTLQAAACYGSIQVEIKQQPSPVISLVDVQDPTCGEKDGSLRIAAYGSSGTLSYSLDGTEFYEDNIFDQLAGGEYQVWVRDDSLCLVSQTVILKQNIELLLNQVEIVPTSCGQSDGSISVDNISAIGTIYYSLNNRAEQTFNSFNNLSAGTYLLSARDENDCKASREIIIDSSDGPQITDVVVAQPECSLDDGSIKIYGSSHSTLSYSISGEDFQSDPEFSELGHGSYTVAIRDENGCTARQETILGTSCDSKIFLPSAFSPNADGINDSWNIFFSMPTIEIQQVTIFNRWGEIVYLDTPGQISSGYQIWNGRYKESQVKGVFSYRLNWQNQSGAVEVLTGKILAF